MKAVIQVVLFSIGSLCFLIGNALHFVPTHKE